MAWYSRARSSLRFLINCSREIASPDFNGSATSGVDAGDDFFEWVLDTEMILNE